MIDLESPGMQKLVAKRILSDIDEYCKKAYDDGHRKHLGASLIGDPCSRKLWYTFRWCVREDFTGRMLRLFNRGHREETRFIEWLEGIGVKVWAATEDGSQYRISGVMGHFGGSLDGVLVLPERYEIPGAMLAEFKTNGTGAPFNNLLSSGVALTKPMHFAQMSTYGYKYELQYGAYFNICKNDDNIHPEIVKLDWNLGRQMEQKAERIILSQDAPPKISPNPTYKDCSYCAAQTICHKGGIPERNCRSCAYASPVENKEWFCSLPAHQAVIPEDFILKACDAYKAITQNV